MTSNFDEQITRAFDSLAERLRTAVADHASTAVERLATIAEIERRAAIEAAAREAADTTEREVSTRLSDAFAEREDAVREAARAEGFEAGVQQARLEAQAAREADAHAAAEAAAEAAAAAAAAQAAAVQAASEHAAAERPAPVVDEADTTFVRRVLHAVRSLDAASSLSQALEALSAAVRVDADRVTIFLVRGDVLRTWSHAGFDAMSDDATFELALAEAGCVADAVRSAAVQRIAADAPGRPAFAEQVPHGAFVAVPLAMNGQVIAVLCAEQVHAADGGESLVMTYELLARHAARVLESLTALRLAQLGTPGASAAPASPPL